MRRPTRPRPSPRRLLAIIVAIVMVCSLSPGTPVGARPAAAPTDLFFSEYIEGSSFNNGDGQGGSFPTSRGANTLAEFNRQRVKEIAAITTIDAGVLGLMEMENDSSGANGAIQDLVNGLNAATSPGRYAFVAEPSPGTDEIKVSLLYQPGRVTPLGAVQNYQFTDPTYGELFERQPPGQSDFLCAQLGLRNDRGAPGDFKLRLNESATASLSWTAPGGQNAYALLAVPLNGSSARILPLGPSATSATDSTGGTFTCYMLLAGLANGVSNTDLTCGLPGIAQFPATATRTTATTTETAGTKNETDTKRAQATAERLFKRKADQVLKGSAQKLEQKLRDGINDAEQQLKRQSDKPPVPKPARRDEPAVTPKPSPTPTDSGTSGSAPRQQARP